MTSRLLRSISFTLVVFALAHPTRADEPGTIAEALKTPILDPKTTLEETRTFVEARVPRMPAVSSADEWTARADQYRQDVFKNVIFRGEAASWRNADLKVEYLETLDGGPGYKIKKLRYEALPGLWVPALLYEPENIEGKVPVILNVNGHDRENGKAADYKQMRCINQAKRGMLALNIEWFGMGQFNTPGFHHGLINAIDLTGTGGIATHYLAMKRGVDILLSHEHADPARVAVTGLSGGGWQTIFYSPLDTRVKLTDPVAGYSSFLTRTRFYEDLGDPEQTPCDLGTVVDYTHLTAMMAPRPTLLTFNEKDNCCFAAPHALQPLLDAAVPIFRLYDKPGYIRSHVNFDPGTHNYEQDNREALYRMLHDFFYTGNGGFPDEEIPSKDEIKTNEELSVPLPDNNADFHTLSVALAKDLPHSPDRPSDRPSAESWQGAQRSALKAIVKPVNPFVDAEKLAEDDHDGLTVRRWKLHAGPGWTIPAVEFSKGDPRAVAIVLNDAGRKESASRIQSLLESGHRVYAIDVFYLGEAAVAEKAYLFALLVGTVGERPLGLQSGQIISAARWAKSQSPGLPLKVISDGPRTGLAALVAAALDREAVDMLEMHNPPDFTQEGPRRLHRLHPAPRGLLLRPAPVLRHGAAGSPGGSPSHRTRRRLGRLKAGLRRPLRLVSDARRQGRGIHLQANNPHQHVGWPRRHPTASATSASTSLWAHRVRQPFLAAKVETGTGSESSRCLSPFSPERARTSAGPSARIRWRTRAHQDFLARIVIVGKLE